jgi:hypothetical protein
MKFTDVYVNKEERFSIGIEEEFQRFFLSFPVSNGFVDYEEYYELTKDQFETFKKDLSAAMEFLRKCRAREQDDLLIVKPGTNRGVAV